MPFSQALRTAAILFVVVLVASPAPARDAPPDAAYRAIRQRSTTDSALLQRIFDVEDARDSSSAGLPLLTRALAHTDSVVRARAVRALGRMEQPSLTRAILPLFADPSPSVRAEAANAAAQAVQPLARADTTKPPNPTMASVATVASAMRARLPDEPDAFVRGALARSLGRLPYRTADDVHATERAIVDAIRRGTSAPPTPVARGARAGSAPARGAAIADAARGAELRGAFFALHGLEALVRRNAARGPFPLARAVLPLTLEFDVPATSSTESIEMARRVRRLSVAALIATGGLDSAMFERAQRDPDPQVRRGAALAATNMRTLDARRRYLDRALADTSFLVRIEAVRGLARHVQPNDCGPLLRAARDANPHVALTAIDALAAPCPTTSMPDSVLSRLIDGLPSGTTPRRSGSASWHLGAHALLASARSSPPDARRAVRRLVAHPVWQVRMYVAHAAGEVRDTATLYRLAHDTRPNVRTAAIEELSRRVGHDADSTYVAALAEQDYQLVLTAARALKGAPAAADVANAVIAALGRITAERRETSRDPRVELMARVRELGSASLAPALEPYQRDYDPEIARAAAETRAAWGATGAVAAPNRMRPLRTTLADAAFMRRQVARITMARESGGGSFDLRLYVDEAPATVARFVALVRRAYFNGLTFHRVVPNFVIQGGSPGANEYVGDARYLRDELSMLNQARGGVGISTRGRDTGDAQLFVNLVGNPRLDHDYTVVGNVVAGMAVVDGILEGDVIERIDLVRVP